MPVYLPGLTFGGLGFGGASFGYSPYGSGILPRPPVAVQYGYGGASYGTSPYGSTDNIPPVVTGANALNGFQVEIFFSEALADDSNLTNTSNYTFDALYGVAITPTEITPATPGPQGGYTSVIVTHTGTTLGGSLTVLVNNVVDLAGNIITPSVIPFYALGDATEATVTLPTVDDGRTVYLDFKTSTGEAQDLLTEEEYSPGVESLYSYGISTEYVIAATITSATQPLLSRVALDVHPMTATDYLLSVGPATVYNYTGSVLPVDDPSLNGVVVGTGESEPTTQYGLLLSKAEGTSYGWFFGDLSGRLLPNSTFKVDLQIDASTAEITPPVSGSTLLIFSVSDGSVQLDIYLSDLFGNKVIGITSGGLSLSALASWDTGPVSIGLVRNQKGSFYTLTFNDNPLLTFPIEEATGVPTLTSGCQVLLNPAHAVQFFGLKELNVTASTTLFTSSWNFIHSLSVPFIGSSVLARTYVRTKKGPLVRGWGDATPAQVNDVAIRVNGISVEIASVNPYVGEITPSIPIPLTAPGTVNVEVDYIWFNNPVFEMSGLNTKGLTLNNWGRALGGVATSTGPRQLGAAPTARFPMGVVLSPRRRQTPKQVAHRYIGLQKNGYSALLNQPSTLLLNQNPHAISVGKINADAFYEKGFFNGQTSPVVADWTSKGRDTGGVTSDGTYRIIDATSGPYGVGDAAFYMRSVDLSLPTEVNLAGRFAVESYVPDGVFTGIGFGTYTGNHLLLIGALIVSGVKHLGVLLDGTNPQLEASWLIGPSVSGTIVTGNTIDIPLAKVYSNRFRIATGDQAGVYTIADCGVKYLSDKVRLTLNENLPGEETDVSLLFESQWDSLISIRALVTTVASVYVGDAFIADQVPLPAYPAQTALLLPVVEKGAAFFGSISRRAENSSLWDIFQYLSTPMQILNTVQGIYVPADMLVLPQDEEYPWYIQGGYGYAQLTGTVALIKATSVAPGSKFAYERTEPYLSPKVNLDLEASFRVDSGILGAGDVEITFNDTSREVSLKTLLYVQGTFPHPDTGLPFTGRSLVTGLPQASLSGLQEPEAAGWTLASGTGSPIVYAEGMYLYLNKALGSDTRYWKKTLTDPVCVNYSGLICEAQVQIVSGTEGFYFGCRVKNSSGPASRFVALGFISEGLKLIDRNFATVSTFPFAWDDGLDHTYRVIIDPVANLISIFVDDSLLGTETLTFFASGIESPEAIMALLGTDTIDLNLHSLSVVPLRPVAKAGSFLGRTFGIVLRSGQGIDGYAIPRADSTKAKNSSLSAIPVQMDWQTLLQTRLYLDPLWGVSFYRPDLAPPPWFTGSYTAQTTDPMAAWITVEYASLPLAQKTRGTIVFGSPAVEAITQSRWDYVRYRLRGDINGFGIAPQNMVLNRAFTYASAEYLNDKTPEIRTVKSRTATLIKVSDSAIYADRVFVVQAAGAVIPNNTWSFDKVTQVLVLSNPLPQSQYPVTLSFAPAKPITATYLEGQPLEASVTILNEGTPSVPRSRDASATFINVTEGDDIYLSPMCDGYGMFEVGFSGSMTSDTFPPTVSSTHFYSGSVLIASGPGVLNQTILYPNARAQDWSPVAPFMGMNQDFWLACESQYEDAFEAFSDMGEASYTLEDFSTSRYSRLGPWAGLEALGVRSLLGGGYPLTGAEFTLSGGAPLYIVSVITTGVVN